MDWLLALCGYWPGWSPDDGVPVARRARGSDRELTAIDRWRIEITSV